MRFIKVFLAIWALIALGIAAVIGALFACMFLAWLIGPKAAGVIIIITLLAILGTFCYFDDDNELP